jgi:hypothetical protein
MDNDPIARFQEMLAQAEQLGIQPFNSAQKSGTADTSARFTRAKQAIGRSSS